MRDMRSLQLVPMPSSDASEFPVPEVARRFASTNWSLVMAAAQGSSPEELGGVGLADLNEGIKQRDSPLGRALRTIARANRRPYPAESGCLTDGWPSPPSRP